MSDDILFLFVHNYYKCIVGCECWFLSQNLKKDVSGYSRFSPLLCYMTYLSVIFSARISHTSSPANYVNAMFNPDDVSRSIKPIIKLKIKDKTFYSQFISLIISRRSQKAY